MRRFFERVASVFNFNFTHRELFKINYLKQCQKQCMVSILIKKDCFVSESTGKGKSGAVVFQGFQFRFIYKVATLNGWLVKIIPVAINILHKLYVTAH